MASLEKIGIEPGSARHISSYTFNNEYGAEPDITEGELLFFDFE